MSKFFIDRPIFAWVIAIFIIAAGIFGIQKLPISQYPSVAAPTITLRATYPGASAQVMEDSVLAVIERNMYGVEGLDYMTTSANSSGSGSVSLTFTPETNEDLAQVDVQNKLSEVLSTLPSTVQQYGVTVSKARSNFLQVVMLSSEKQSIEEMNDYAQRNIIPELQRIDGVGQVQLFGAQRAMRIWVDPKKLQNYNLSFATVTNALATQNIQISAGSIGSLPAAAGQTISATVTAEGQLRTAEEVGNIILVSNTDGSNVYLKDVAKVSLGMQDYSTSTRLNGVNTTGMAVMLSNSGNALATATAVKEKMAVLQKDFPDGMSWKVPISLLGGFAFISYMGMSINVLTMFAMVLVIGIVVDDAIVVVENVERIMASEGLPPKAATKKAMSQVSGAVIGITAVLMSVFVPLAMFSGATGNIYKQFALTMVASIGFSAFLALTLTPALCATMLKPIQNGHHEEKKGFFGWFNKKFDNWTHGYEGWVAKVLRKTLRMMVVYIGLTVVGVFLFMRLPTSFLPTEDQGNLMLSVQLPAGATKERTDATLAQITQLAKSVPEIENIVTVSGFSFSGSGQNMALGFVILKDWSERTAPGSDATSISGKLTGMMMATLKDGFGLAIVPPAIMELGTGSGLTIYLQDRNNSGHAALLAKRNELIDKMRKSGLFNPSTVRASGLEDAPQLKIDINRAAAAAQGISFSDIRTALASSLGSSYVNDFPNQGRLQRVMVQADASARMQPADILNLTVPNKSGVAVPLSTIATVSWENGMEQSVRFNGYPAMELSGSPVNGVSSGQAMAAVQQMVDEMGGGYSLEWGGQSREEAKGSSQTVVLYALAAAAVFLVLAALYESWSIPLAVILVIPLGLIGAALGVTGRNMFEALLGSIPAYANDIYFQVGFVTVMGLSAKNAILIIEFAKDLQAQGKSALEAALAAAHLRFRPIIMTSFAFILGVVPLYVASGASSASQRAIGTTVVWGMLIGTILSVFLVPLFYVVVRKFFKETAHEHEMAAKHAAEAGMIEDGKHDSDKH